MLLQGFHVFSELGHLVFYRATAIRFQFSFDKRKSFQHTGHTGPSGPGGFTRPRGQKLIYSLNESPHDTHPSENQSEKGENRGEPGHEGGHATARSDTWRIPPVERLLAAGGLVWTQRISSTTTNLASS